MGPGAIAQRVQAEKRAENRAEPCSLTACNGFYAAYPQRVNEIPLRICKVKKMLLVIVFTTGNVKKKESVSPVGRVSPWGCSGRLLRQVPQQVSFCGDPPPSNPLGRLRSAVLSKADRGGAAIPRSVATLWARIERSPTTSLTLHFSAPSSLLRTEMPCDVPFAATNATMKLHRRQAIAAGLGTLLVSSLQANEVVASPLTSVGLCQYCGRFAGEFAKRQSPPVNLFEPEHFFEHCRVLGAGGYQVALGILEPARAAALRERAAAAGMYIEGIVSAPKRPSDLDRFEAEMRSAAAVGAKAVRSTIFTGRRYEYFDSLAEYKDHDAQARRSLELAAPIAEKYRVAFAPENHKDHRIAERVAALCAIDSEYVGVCVDTGNNFALLEDPVETVKALAPWTHAVHIKDQAVRLVPEGFLFGDIPLGQGFIDLKQIVSILRQAQPEVHFTLELLTRDPLLVPCLEPSYWSTFPDLPAEDLARTLRTVRDHQAEALQYPSKLTLNEQVALERQNVVESILFARDQLGLLPT